jgi:hypothetical protein
VVEKKEREIARAMCSGNGGGFGEGSGKLMDLVRSCSTKKANTCPFQFNTAQNRKKKRVFNLIVVQHDRSTLITALRYIIDFSGGK